MFLMPAHSTTDAFFAFDAFLHQLAQPGASLDEILATAVHFIAENVSADRGTLYLYDAARDELLSRAADLPEIKEIRLKRGQGIAGKVAMTAMPLRVPLDKVTSMKFSDIDAKTGYSTKSALAVPVVDAQNQMRGVLQVLNAKSGSGFSQADEAQLQKWANRIWALLEHTSLKSELERADHSSPKVQYLFNQVIGNSAPMAQAYKRVQKIAPTEATVLILGETGVGKELFAKAIHANSPRRHKPLVKVDCAALPPTLIENELFGHERGAFTGADSRTLGKIETAQEGTLFLDEVGELPLSIQAKLLRFLQEREFSRLGSHKTLKADVRIVAATHRPLRDMVTQGTFREDLYFRLKVVELPLPSLRKRGASDIERLALHFLAAATEKHRLAKAPRLTQEALSRLIRYPWPGNVRELENVIEGAVVLSDGVIEAQHLSLAAAADDDAAPAMGKRFLTLAEIESAHIQRALEFTNGNHTKTAKLLGIGRNTLLRKLKHQM